MKNRKFLILGFFLLQFFYGCSKIGTDTEVKTRIVQVKPLLVLAELQPKPSNEFLVIDNFFDVDHESNFYFVDRNNHRILKFDHEGSFLYQIGSVGQESPDLYHPGPIHINNDILYVANNGSKEIKKFSLSGEFISKLEVKNLSKLNTLYATNGMIYMDARYHLDGYSKRKLITVLDNEGKFIKRLGKIQKTKNWLEHKFLNASIFQVENNKVYGAFKYYPVIFQYDIKGNIVFYKDLSKQNISEIDELNELFVQKEAHMLMKKKNNQENTIRAMTYCNGFAIDNNGHSYYAVQKSNDHPRILHLDKNGNIVESLIMMNGEQTVGTANIYIKKSIKYALGFIGNWDKCILFTF